MGTQEAAAVAWDDEVRWILGRPNFSVARLAQRLQQMDPLYKATEARAEDEQAVAIHWMLNLYLKHGREWRSEADKLFSSKPNG